MNGRMAMAGLISPSTVCFFSLFVNAFVVSSFTSLASHDDDVAGADGGQTHGDGKTMPGRVDNYLSSKKTSPQLQS